MKLIFENWRKYLKKEKEVLNEAMPLALGYGG